MDREVIVQELTVQADLSQTSLETAREQIVDTVGTPGIEGFSYTVLRVASQNMGEAVVLRVHNSFYLDIDFLYQPDEWSLHTFKSIKNKISLTDDQRGLYSYYEYVVHSMGA